MSMTAIDDVKARLDIVETVQSYVPELKKSGRTFKARCPFHTERTPSFVVDPERSSWHCFGACSTGGDVISFVQRIEGLEFPEALRRCAERAGVELRPPSRRELAEREEHERLLRANEAAAVFFQAALRDPAGGDARAYAESRGLDAAAQDRWQLGYAPDDWQALSDHLNARGFSEADIIEAGLAVRREERDGSYDRFRGRLIFPTRDQRRRLIGFGARALKPEDEPKYLNTPQTALFDKSGTLYGIDRAFDAIRREDLAVIVEGYTDVIAAHQAGLEHVVASNGTAITERQMALIKRYTQNLVLALDADAAGSEAALRGVEVAAGAADTGSIATVDWRGLVSYQDVLQADIRIASLPPGEDPDSLIRNDPDAFRRLVDEAKPVADHLFDVVSAALAPDDARGRSNALQTLAPTVAAMSDPVVQAHYVQKLARLAHVDERTVMQLLGRQPRTRAAARPRPLPTAADLRAATRTPNAAADGEQQLLQLLVQRREARGPGLAIDTNLFEDSTNRHLFEIWCADVDLSEHLDDHDIAVVERYEQVASVPLPDYEPRHVGEMVESMARALRLRRESSRLFEAFREHTSDGQASAAAAASAIAGGEAEDGTALNEIDAHTVELTARQIALRAQTRGHAASTEDAADEHEGAEVRRPAVAGGEPNGEGSG
jgi:DNA primase